MYLPNKPMAHKLCLDIHSGHNRDRDLSHRDRRRLDWPLELPSLSGSLASRRRGPHASGTTKQVPPLRGDAPSENGRRLEATPGARGGASSSMSGRRTGQRELRAD